MRTGLVQTPKTGIGDGHVMTRSDQPILLIEGSDDEESNFLHALRQAGLENPVLVLHSAEGAMDFLERIHAERETARHLLPGMVMLNFNLPGKDGFALLEWLESQAQFKKMLIVTLTGATDPADWWRAYQFGADSFLRKPVKPDELKNLVDTHACSWAESF